MEPIEKYGKSLDEIDGVFPRENQAPINLDKVRLRDHTKNREGTVLRLIPVKSDKQNISFSWKVEYVEDVDMFKSPIKAMKMLMGFVDTTITTDKFPDNAVQIGTNPTDSGAERLVILHETEEGKAEMKDLDKEGVDKGLAKAQEKAGEAESEAMLNKAKNLGLKGGKRAASESETPNKKSSRRSRGDRRGSRKNRRKRR